ncbi:unnamed protein product, partial [Adineta ricciae]
ANVTIYTLPKFQPQGTVIKLNTSRSLLSRPNKPVTIPDLTIDSLGMYILNILLVSTNNQYIVTLTSNGILVKNAFQGTSGIDDYDTDNFVTDVNYLTSNITFVNNYDDLKASNQLEIKRAMIYNYLLSISMPLISDVVLKEGEMVVLFQVDALPVDIDRAVTTILSNPNVIPDLTVSSVNINGRSYSVSPTTNQNMKPNDDNKTSLLVGIPVGVIGIIIIVGIVGATVYFFQNRKQKQTKDKYSQDEVGIRQRMDGVIHEFTELNLDVAE